MLHAYALAQAMMILTSAAAITVPAFVFFEYMGALDARCSLDSQEFFEMYQTRRMLTVYMCVELVITRTLMLLQCNKILGIADGAPMYGWGPADRVRWFTASVACALVMDAMIIVWLANTSDLCDHSTQSEQKARSLRDLCVHSMDIGSGVRVMHAVNCGLCVALYAAVSRWWLASKNVHEVAKTKYM